MISKLRNYHRKFKVVVYSPDIVELTKIFSFIIIFTMMILMVVHLVLTGEFGFCYWSLKGGWIWS